MRNIRENKDYYGGGKSYRVKVVENSSLLGAVAGNVGRQFEEVFNRSPVVLIDNLNLPPLSIQSQSASLQRRGTGTECGNNLLPPLHF